ncbi:5-enolpyruvylshikimate-3-phosphate synthase [Lentilactobacillus farraginis DSM 18382 = JCM 14108]|uniref:5-enolpyruvylshikimate-3-phosphate synthase n=1 Tax=Lentilactobacillus farraginis DSM 18382 = JCM 14108 TaxID=1423743 RepID=X0P9Y4_9LACO|nr:5-enolpyruvylshikimate-3-phosphate synthase [Lentilactobacillus farraginis DSM 18382 = JCM 14108]
MRVKETDRIAAVVQEFTKLGITIRELPDGFVIDGSQPWQVKKHQLDSHGDHRIGMTLAIASLLVDTSFQLAGAESVNISYPEFFDDLESVMNVESYS